MPEREPSILKEDGDRATNRDPIDPRAPRAVPVTARDAALTVVVAGFWRRAMAALVDLVVILPIAALLTWVAGKLGGFALPAARHRGPDFWLDLAMAGDPAVWGALGLSLAISLLYLLLFQAMLSRTPGMRLFGLRVIDVYGDPPSVLRSAVRTFGYVLCLATFSLGFLWIGFDREKRGLHDWVSGTYVIKGVLDE
jgi:uncharacterized RDD family membrane protein YckC